MNYNEALEFIHSVSNYFCKPGLARIKALCESLGNPQNSLKFVHIAGTNGKGSFCAFLSSILKESGYKVGTYTSPFILRFNERIAINGEPISDNDLADITSQLSDICDFLEDKPTEFELITAIAFKYFKDKNCDIVVLECGMGGRFDATNIIESPCLSVITGVDFDHQNFLGNTISLIANEKAGIIKRNTPCLWCGNSEEAYKVIKDEAESKNSRLYKIESKPEIKVFNLSRTVFDFEDYKNLEIGLLGTYQPINAANAIKAAKILTESGFNIPQKAIYSGLKNTVWPARFEKLSPLPIIFDGSHNPQGVRAAKESVKLYFKDRKVNILSGVMRDKDYPIICKEISEIANKVYCVTVDNPRALESTEYKKEYEKLGINAEDYKCVKEALLSAIEDSIENRIPLICMGSLYMYSQIYETIKGAV